MPTLLGFVVLFVMVYGQYYVMEIPMLQKEYLTAPVPLPKINVYETKISPSARPQTSSAPIVNAEDQEKYLTASSPLPKMKLYKTEMLPSIRPPTSNPPIVNKENEEKYPTAPAPLQKINLYETGISPSARPQVASRPIVNAEDQGKYLTASTPLPKMKFYKTEMLPSARPPTLNPSIVHIENEEKYPTAPAPLPKTNVYKTEILPNGRPQISSPPILNTQDEGKYITAPIPFPERNIYEPKISSPARAQTSSTPIVNTEDEINISIDNNNNHECGISNPNRLYYGYVRRFVEFGQYPWLAAMFYFNEGNYGYRCGASIISHKHLITAAHCMKDQNGVNLNKEDIIFVMGDQDIKNWVTGSTIRGINEYIIHPDYKHPADADLAVIVLDSPVIFSEEIYPICLWDESTELLNIVGLDGSIAGWKQDQTKTEFDATYVNVTTHKKCLWADDRFKKLTSNRTFCAGDRSRDELCTGYSGSGSVLEHDGLFYLRGILSVALADSVTETCDAVFSDVTKFDKWIRLAMQLS